MYHLTVYILQLHNIIIVTVVPWLSTLFYLILLSYLILHRRYVDLTIELGVNLACDGDLREVVKYQDIGVLYCYGNRVITGLCQWVIDNNQGGFWWPENNFHDNFYNKPSANLQLVHVKISILYVLILNTKMSDFTTTVVTCSQNSMFLWL